MGSPEALPCSAVSSFDFRVAGFARIQAIGNKTEVWRLQLQFITLFAWRKLLACKLFETIVRRQAEQRPQHFSATMCELSYEKSVKKAELNAVLRINLRNCLYVLPRRR